MKNFLSRLTSLIAFYGCLLPTVVASTVVDCHGSLPIEEMFSYIPEEQRPPFVTYSQFREAEAILRDLRQRASGVKLNQDPVAVKTNCNNLTRAYLSVKDVLDGISNLSTGDNSEISREEFDAYFDRLKDFEMTLSEIQNKCGAAPNIYGPPLQSARDLLTPFCRELLDFELFLKCAEFISKELLNSIQNNSEAATINNAKNFLHLFHKTQIMAWSYHLHYDFSRINALNQSLDSLSNKICEYSENNGKET